MGREAIYTTNISYLKDKYPMEPLSFFENIKKTDIQMYGEPIAGENYRRLHQIKIKE